MKAYQNIENNEDLRQGALGRQRPPSLDEKQPLRRDDIKTSRNAAKNISNPPQQFPQHQKHHDSKNIEALTEA